MYQITNLWPCCRVINKDWRSVLLASSLILLAVPFGDSEAQVSLGATEQVTKDVGGSSGSDNSNSTPALSGNGNFMAFQSFATNLIAGDTNNKADIFLKNLKSGSLTRISLGSGGIEADDDSSNPSISNVTPNGFFAVAYSSFATNLTEYQPGQETRNIYLYFPQAEKNLLVSRSLIDLDNNGLADGSSSFPSIAVSAAPETAYVAFSSSAINLVEIDNPNRLQQIYLASVLPPSASNKDLGELKSMEHISKNSAGQPANSGCIDPEISGDGRFIVYSSYADNLTVDDSNALSQIFLFDTTTKQTTLLSKNAQGVVGDLGSEKPHVSFSGRFVTFSSYATNLVSNDNRSQAKLILLDRNTGIMSQINTGLNDQTPDGEAFEGRITPNGRFVVFSDSSTNLISADQNNATDVFLKDLKNGQLIRASLNSSGGELSSTSDSAFIAGESFNSLKAILSFRSFASSVTSLPANPQGELYTSTVTFPKPTIDSETKIEAPADVINPRRRIVRVNMQAYSIDTTPSSILSAEVGEANKRQVMYDVRLQDSKRAKNRQQSVGNKNRATFRNVKPGTYSVRYRVSVKNGSKTETKTPFSPRQEFKVR